jgi:hypothetical protein
MSGLTPAVPLMFYLTGILHQLNLQLDHQETSRYFDDTARQVSRVFDNGDEPASLEIL